MILKLYWELEEPTQDLTRTVQAGLLDEENGECKELAWRRLFEEMVIQENSEEIIPKG